MNPQPKTKPFRNADYLKFTRSVRQEIHHESCLPDAEKLMGGKPSDYYGISLDPYQHKRRHDLGYITFWAGVFALDVKNLEIRALVTVEVQRVVIKNMIEYIESKKGTMPGKSLSDGRG